MFMQFFSHINIPPEQVHILDETVEDLKEECATYEKHIKEVGGIDLFLAGIGEDGDLAFNEPGESQQFFTIILILMMPRLISGITQPYQNPRL
jgi:glucosamine-6-phosphate deaminase